MQPEDHKDMIIGKINGYYSEDIYVPIEGRGKSKEGN